METKKFIAGGLSGFIEVTLTHPIDYLKVKRQEFKQTGHSLKNFYKDITPNGFRSLYTGYLPRLAGIVPMRFVFWGSQDTTRQLLLNNNINTSFNFLFIGITGAFFQTIVDNQAEIIKISRISNISKEQTYKAIIKFQGFNTCLLRNIGFNTCISYLCFNDGIEDKNAFEKMKNAAFGGLVGSLLTHPIDYVKTHKHRTIDKRSMITILQEIVSENPRQLYTGGMFRAISNFSTMGIGFVCYDFIKGYL